MIAFGCAASDALWTVLARKSFVNPKAHLVKTSTPAPRAFHIRKRWSYLIIHLPQSFCQLHKICGRHNAASHGTHLARYLVAQCHGLTGRQLTKEEEASAGGEDVQVRREDQEKINRFSSLHQKETALEDELRAKLVSPASCGRITQEADLGTTPACFTNAAFLLRVAG